MTIYTNGKIFTGSRLCSWMEVLEGVVTGLGNDNPPAREDVVDLEERVVLPGLHDSHIHVYSLGRSASRLNLQNTGSIAELQRRLEVFSKDVSDDEWVVGFGWNQDEMEDGRYPTKADIDPITSNPVVLLRACHHIGLLNSRALQILGISSSSPNPEGGIIDKVDGFPTGILREKALSLVTPHIENHLNHVSKIKRLRIGLQKCLEVGLTSVQTNDPQAWKAYKELAETGALPIRVYLTIPYSEIDDDELPPPGTQVGNLRLDRVKLFADGSLGASTAALREPYSDLSAADGDNKGVLIHSDDGLLEKVKKASSRGWRIEIHGIGDAAAEQILDVFSEVISHRPVLTHAQVLGKDLIERMSHMDVVANIQPIFINTDSGFVDSRVGSRAAYSYAWRTMLKSGVKVAGGSDAPIESPNPLLGMYASVFRKGNPAQDAWRKEESLNFTEALSLFTTGGSYASCTEESIGKLEVGFKADFVVVDRDVLEDHSLLYSAKVEKVYVNGDLVFSLSS